MRKCPRVVDGGCYPPCQRRCIARKRQPSTQEGEASEEEVQQWTSEAETLSVEIDVEWFAAAEEDDAPVLAALVANAN